MCHTHQLPIVFLYCAGEGPSASSVALASPVRPLVLATACSNAPTSSLTPSVVHVTAESGNTSTYVFPTTHFSSSMSDSQLACTTATTDTAIGCYHAHTGLTCPLLDPLQAQISQPICCFRHTAANDSLWLVCTHPDHIAETKAGPLYTPRLCVCCDGKVATYSWQVFFKTTESGPADSDKVLSLLLQLQSDSLYVVCPGIMSYPSEIKFKTKHLRMWGEPFGRMDSEHCAMWHIPNNRCQLPNSPLFNACKACKLLDHDIQVLSKRASNLTSMQKEARKSASSKYPF